MQERLEAGAALEEMIRSKRPDGKMCPILTLKPVSLLDGPIYCSEEKCAWWVPPDEQNEGGCGIKVLAELYRTAHSIY